MLYYVFGLGVTLMLHGGGFVSFFFFFRRDINSHERFKLLDMGNYLNA